MRLIKEQKCYLSPDAVKEEKEWLPSQNEAYTLPDGRNITLGQEKFRAGEILFNPEIVGLEYVGVHEMLTQSVGKVDMDLRQDLYQNIVLSGGTTMLKGMESVVLYIIIFV